ncbi:cadherin-23-like [Mercenaria mercenaria]|uniref:cadherin-23-like n=1 Tax=Mercenaria mercenaria TaxID=6596 RepID=UPI00234E5795|nr:cadherin-23-like [Mercenaria mercenaria]
MLTTSTLFDEYFTHNIITALGEAVFTGWIIPETDSANGSGNITLYENQPVGATDIKFKVKEDQDSVGYKMETLTDDFSVWSRGRLILKTPLDYEVMKTYVLEISATTNSSENGSPGSSATATVTVNIIDVNNPPAFKSSSYGICVADGLDSGTDVIQAEATGDSSLMSYSIANGDDNGYFVIGNTTGMITVAPNKTLDASVTRGYALQIKVKDEGEDESPYDVTATTSVFIVLADMKCSIANTINIGVMTVLLTQILNFLF